MKGMDNRKVFMTVAIFNIGKTPKNEQVAFIEILIKPHPIPNTNLELQETLSFNSELSWKPASRK